MAFYEMLPGTGMPSGLQAGMDSVLNKKFGTSTTYPAEGWPDNVNLLGPLPEKTVSGAIVTFSDGADAVPLKKCEITLPASLDGYSEVDVVSAGKNLLNFSAFSDYSNWETDITENQSYPTGNANRGLLLDLPQGIYTVSFGIDAETYPKYLYLCKDDGSTSTRLIYFTGANFSVFSGTFTVDGTSKYYFRMGSTDSEENFNSQIAKIAWGQIEEGSTATTFEPYSGTTYTATLGRTIYGGTADVVKGTGTRYAYKEFDGTETFYLADATGTSRRFTTPIELNTGTGLVSFGELVNTSEGHWGQFRLYSAGYFGVLDNTSNFANASALKSYLAEQKALGNPLRICFELATPETFTFDPVPIDSKLGNNTLWAEQGSSVEVTYRADINLALGGN